MKMIECFKIRLTCTDSPDDCFNLKTHTHIIDKRPGLQFFKLHPTIVFADPFLFVHKDTLFLFYEKQTYWNPGVIEMVSTKDLIRWSCPRVILQERCHLSYPFVFEENGEVYMIPETHQLGEVRLYKANSELTKFSYNNTLIGGNRDYADSSIIIKDGIYYLATTTINNNSEYQLNLLISNELKQPFSKHPASPIATGNKYGRNGGGFVFWKDKLFRISQDCENGYGENLNVFQVDTLNETTYSENLSHENVIPKDILFYHNGGHHLSTVNFLGKTVVATDAKEYKTFAICQSFYEIKRLIKRLL